ncbi:DNA alkylation response protein [Aeromicrobium sp. PE09-221]|uniref:acyl-CoA dehydrogenase family protein n=1 Tax=Aeromicrobium sp. PE09-221 TaxID=1898043 RepID=UPI000B3E905E|nr:acyl-CoA dehydrogenase family protein [Aeromicrobium sp. PE09-221]OUZ11268.1 DNA alkylation response protein [Aeromicrobium sp. PE09-221]
MSRTHEVLNQSPPRVDVNEYTSNVPLTEAVARYDADWAHDALVEAGGLVGRADFQRDAELANTITPVHHSHDRWGHRVDEIEFHPAYHRIFGEAISRGAHTSCWTEDRKGAHVARAAMFMQFGQIESGHSCPVSMTHAVVPSLRLAEASLREFWLPKVFATSYDPELRDPATKASAVFGMAMTEKQGGSDVRANTTRAVPSADGTWNITGHKWFCSAPQSDAFLMLAQTESGLSCFVVPRVLPGGELNRFFVQRLKNKLGNKSNASSEIEVDGATGWLAGDEGRGVRTIIEMVNQTRLDCIFGSASGMRQSVAEAAWHAAHRRAFGSMLIDQPAMEQVIADLHLEAEAATWTAMRMAAAFDASDEQSAAFARLGTAVAKYWICKRGPHHAYEAMECLGGNGYTEDFPLARRYREQPVMAIWEGSGNVIALDVLRAMAREPQAVEAFVEEVGLARGLSVGFDAHLDRMGALLSRAAEDPGSAPAFARRVVESMALALQGSVLLREAPTTVADAFVLGRLGADRSFEYGGLPQGVNTTALVARAGLPH